VLIAAGRDGHEIAARVAVRLDSGIITDAVDVYPGPMAGRGAGGLRGSYAVGSTVRTAFR